jgi:hypothetical protein
MEVWSLVLVWLLVSLGFGLFFLSFQRIEGTREYDIPKTYQGLSKIFDNGVH